MRQAVLLGTPDTKRTIYLKKAMDQAAMPLHVVTWKDWKEALPKGELFLKIDPPKWESCSLAKLDGLIEGYHRELLALTHQAEELVITWFNTPSAIAALLDKRSCKAVLKEQGLPVTQSFPHMPLKMEALLEEMKRAQVCQIFIKPNYGSGALGVSAFRIQPRTGKMVLYTCAAFDEEDRLVNTKRLVRLSDPKQIEHILQALLSLDCVIERWYQKAQYQGCSYDLRAVVQDGRMDFLLGRLSKGPITNLQLNNRPLDIKELALPDQILEEIECLCVQAMKCFPGLRSAGIDLLLERGSLKPRIIEMNAQGDLIYQDIYRENRIYRHQAEMIKNSCM